MDCARVAREEILASYMLGRLNQETREAFEEHYFECERCFGELQTLQAVREELGATDDRVSGSKGRVFGRWSGAAGLAAGVIMAVGLLLWMRAPRPPRLREAAGAPSPSQAHPPGPSKPEQPQASTATLPTREQLAQVEPPVYEPRTLRGPSNGAAESFKRGMEHYRKADYPGAMKDLSTAAALDPDAAHIRFFLGISYLMSGHDKDAIDQLRATIALGDSPYLEDAYFYLAKALVRRNDLNGAEAQLKKLVQLHGFKSVEAGRLLAQVERFKQRSD